MSKQIICEYYEGLVKKSSVSLSPQEIVNKVGKARMKARKDMIKTDKEHVLFAIITYSSENEIEIVRIFQKNCLSDKELDKFIKSYSNSRFEVLHRGTCLKACEILERKAKSREIRPITLKEANTFINQYHRHHNGTVGCKYAIGLFEDNKMIGAAICGRPVSRYLDNGEVCEINRLCTLGDENACSQLYGACARIAQNMGYKKIITYILQSESGFSLKASNFLCEGEAGGTHWTGKRNRGQNIPSEKKTRWTRMLV